HRRWRAGARRRAARDSCSVAVPEEGRRERPECRCFRIGHAVAGCERHVGGPDSRSEVPPDLGGGGASKSCETSGNATMPWRPTQGSRSERWRCRVDYPMTKPEETQVRVYRAADAVRGALAGESVAVLGYGHLGRTAALNLRDSGVKVRIGNREDEYAAQARTDGFEVVSIAAAAVDDVVYVVLPDEVIPTLFDSEIAPALGPGRAIALRAGAVQMTAKAEATLDLFVEQTVGAVLGMAIMMAFEVARDAGVPAEALVLEMYMSGEMEAVFQSFRETGFLRASEDHGPTAVF